MEANESLSRFQELGLLLDTEVDFGGSDEKIAIIEYKKVLIQIFTQPLFDEKTFFLAKSIALFVLKSVTRQMYSFASAS